MERLILKQRLRQEQEEEQEREREVAKGEVGLQNVSPS